MRVSGFAVIAALGICLVATPVAQQQVAITDLGTVGAGNWSSAGAVNSPGQVAGWAFVGGPFTLQRAIVWDRGTAVQLGALCDDCGSVALDINDATEVVGIAFVAPGEARGFVWRNGVMTELPPLAGDTFAIAHSINNRGEIVGQSSGASGGRPVIWRNNQAQDLGIGSGSAFAINDAGHIVGQILTSAGVMRAFVLRNGVVTDLGAAPSSTCPEASNAVGINEAGQIVGTTQVDCGNRAVTWINDTIQLLPALDPAEPRGAAQDINEHGDIVGFSGALQPMAQAVLWRGGSVLYLGSLAGPTVRSLASDINDDGLIVGSSTVSTDLPALDHAVTFSLALSPEDQLAALIESVEGIGPGTSLASKLLSARASFDAGNTAATCGTLSAFAKEVAAQTGKKLTAEQAAEFSAAAQAIRERIGC